MFRAEFSVTSIKDKSTLYFCKLYPRNLKLNSKHLGKHFTCVVLYHREIRSTDSIPSEWHSYVRQSFHTELPVSTRNEIKIFFYVKNIFFFLIQMSCGDWLSWEGRYILLRGMHSLKGDKYRLGVVVGGVKGEKKQENFLQFACLT